MLPLDFPDRDLTPPDLADAPRIDCPHCALGEMRAEFVADGQPVECQRCGIGGYLSGEADGWEVTDLDTYCDADECSDCERRYEQQAREDAAAFAADV